MNDNRALINGLKKQKIDALESFSKKYSNLIYKVAYGVLNSNELSLECLNDVLLKIWDNAKYFDRPSDNLPNWVMAITKYSAIDILRREVKHSNKVSLAFAVDSSYDDSLDKLHEIMEIKNKINKMDEPDKSIFIRRFFNDESTKKISKDLGVSEKFINLRVFRGRKRLLKELKEEC